MYWQSLEPLLATSSTLPAPELGHFVPIATHGIATPLPSMVLRCIVENEGTRVGIRATAQILELCHDQKFSYRPRQNRKSQMLAFKQRARSIPLLPGSKNSEMEAG
jgi:hypothetical protein